VALLPKEPESGARAWCSRARIGRCHVLDFREEFRHAIVMARGRGYDRVAVFQRVLCCRAGIASLVMLPCVCRTAGWTRRSARRCGASASCIGCATWRLLVKRSIFRHHPNDGVDGKTPIADELRLRKRGIDVKIVSSRGRPDADKSGEQSRHVAQGQVTVDRQQIR